MDGWVGWMARILKTLTTQSLPTLLPVLGNGEAQDDGPHEAQQQLLVPVHYVRGADVGELEPLLAQVIDCFVYVCGGGGGKVDDAGRCGVRRKKEKKRRDDWPQSSYIYNIHVNHTHIYMYIHVFTHT